MRPWHITFFVVGLAFVFGGNLPGAYGDRDRVEARVQPPPPPPPPPLPPVFKTAKNAIVEKRQEQLEEKEEGSPAVNESNEDSQEGAEQQRSGYSDSESDSDSDRETGDDSSSESGDEDEDEHEQKKKQKEIDRLKTTHLYEKGMKKSNEHLFEAHEEMDRNLRHTEEDAEIVHETMNKYSEHVHYLDKQMNGLEQKIDNLAKLRTEQFGNHEAERLKDLDDLSPEAQAQLAEMEAIRKAKEANTHESGMTLEKEQHLSKVFEEIERSSKHGKLQDALNVLKKLNNENGGEQTSENHSDEGPKKEEQDGGSNSDSDGGSDGDEKSSETDASGTESSLLQRSWIQSEHRPTNSDAEPSDDDSGDSSDDAEDGQAKNEKHSEGEGLDARTMPGEQGWDHLDKDKLIPGAANLMTADQKKMAEKLWKYLPTDEMKRYNPEYYQALHEELDMKNVKRSMAATDLMDDTGKSLAQNAAKATEAVVKVHAKMEDWHNVLKTNIADLDRFSLNVTQLRSHALHELQGLNKDRLENFDILNAGAAKLNANGDLAVVESGLYAKKKQTDT